ncbi:MAG: hypothetical protein RIQ81_2341 [Pseudomonadota bacterium]
MNLGLRYGGIVGCVAFMFGNFIACGAQMYRVSVEDDHDKSKISAESMDPNSPTFGLHSPRGFTKLPIEFRIGQQMDSQQKTGLEAAMKTWEIAVGKSLFRFVGVHENTDGDSFPDLYSSLRDSINGNYLDNNWKKTGKPDVVLATTIWNNSPRDAAAIDTADVRFNSQDYVIGDSLRIKGQYVESTGQYKDPVDMQTLALHELGHLLGLTHIAAEIDAVSIMNPYVYIGEGLTSRHLSEGDIERIQKIYGCLGAACDISRAVEMVTEFTKNPPAETAEVR